MPAAILQWAGKETVQPERLEKSEQKIAEELAECPGIEKRWMKKLAKFLVQSGIGHISEMDYPLRAEYEIYLEATPQWKKNCLKTFDKVVKHEIQKQMQTLSGRQKNQWKYRNRILFLPYHPDQGIASEFEEARKSDILIWDFEKACPEKLKQQIFGGLDYILHNCNKDPRFKRKKLLTLQYFYTFCVENDISDVEMLEKTDIEKYLIYIENSRKEANLDMQAMAVVTICRKESFVNSADIHWYAGVWYLDRLHLPKDRVNPSASKEGISFLEIHDLSNRKYAQEYMKYELGITGQAVSTILKRYLSVREFIVFLEQKEVPVCGCGREHADAYFRKLLGRNLGAKGFNERVFGITHFYKFLTVRRYVERVPFRQEYYMQKVMPVHHDRSVEMETYIGIMQKLRYFPEHLRCMFLHLWCLGLRGSEVCTLKGNAYYRQGEDFWIQIYQIKTKGYKRIPVPEGLYEIMRVYIKKYQIELEEYIFKNTKGGAFLYPTFRVQMLKHCRENQIQGGEYIFKSHDYRHTVASLFYDHEVSLQSIRDYLGHMYDEMTQQYIDYMPRRIEAANEEYFEEPDNNLAAGLREGGAYGKR